MATSTSAPLPILRRAGAVLVVVGLADIAILVYCIANGIPYTSSFNVFAVAAGVFLLCGSLRAAAVVRWLAAFTLTGMLCVVALWPSIQPLGLTLVQIRLAPVAFVRMSLLGVALACFLGWLIAELGSEPVQDARVALGRKRQGLRIPVALSVASIFTAVLWLRGGSANRAKALAAEQLGNKYSYHVSQLRVSRNARGKSVLAIVTAWNGDEVKTVPVHWKEK